MQEKLVLGIESSCDDTSICLLRGVPGTSLPKILIHQSFSQEKILHDWGGIIPEIAARNHLLKITPLIKAVFEKANHQLSDIDLIGVTTHPGLLGPLLTGLNAAKSISLLNQKPIYGVNHLYAHLEAIHLTEEVSYPYLGLIVSGGHSLFILVKQKDNFEILGSTIDDAAGEAFDKGGKLMGLGYPAGKLIDDRAKNGDKTRYDFPIGLKQSGDANLSFSGLKTALRHFLEKHPKLVKDENKLNDLCASYQNAIVLALSLKLRHALKSCADRGLKSIPIVMGGGVACNSALRKKIQSEYKNVHIVKPEFCTDNGAMVANYALRMFDQAVEFPDCLRMDSYGKFIDKKEVQKAMKS